MEEARTIFQHLGLSAVNEDNGTASMAYVERFKVLVEYKDWKVDHTFSDGLDFVYFT